MVAVGRIIVTGARELLEPMVHVLEPVGCKLDSEVAKASDRAQFESGTDRECRMKVVEFEAGMRELHELLEHLGPEFDFPVGEDLTRHPEAKDVEILDEDVDGRMAAFQTCKLEHKLFRGDPLMRQTHDTRDRQKISVKIIRVRARGDDDRWWTHLEFVGVDQSELLGDLVRIVVQHPEPQLMGAEPLRIELY